MHEIEMGRRNFLALMATGGLATVAGSGCATNPVSGKRQFMLVNEAQERAFDRQLAPRQFSADFGPVNDVALSAYVNRLGVEMGRLSHRPTVHYNFRALNAVIANAYTFPAGSVGISRGLLLAMENEAQLAGVLGHEIGHVTSRHAAEKMSKGFLTQAAVAGVTLYVQHEHEKYTDLAYGLGAVGAGALLAHYSREDEREADSLGMTYMVKAGHNPQGMPQLMKTLMTIEKTTPSMVNLLFATHPMTRKRFDWAEEQARTHYARAQKRDVQRDRYMDATASVRRIGVAIREMEKGQLLLVRRKYAQSEKHLAAALKEASDDYAALILMSKCLGAQNRLKEAEAYARQAKRVAPTEPQADLMMGSLALQQDQPQDALRWMTAYDRRLPNNPDVVFLKGLSLERLGQLEAASREYARYQQLAPGGRQTGYIHKRLTAWQSAD